MAQSVFTHQFDNGLVLLAEPMDWLKSAAFNLLIPGGASRDPADRLGLSNFACEMVQRGAGDRDSRQFVEDLENLGAGHGGSVSNASVSFGGAMPAENLYEVLSVFADVVRRPLFPENELEDGRNVCLLEIESVEDDLSQRVINELRQRQFTQPFGRSSMGTIEAVSQITLDEIHSHFEKTFRPNETILSVAGNIDWPKLKDQVGEMLGDWPAVDLPAIETQPAVRGYHHISHDSQQTQICAAFSSVPYSHPDYFQVRGAVGVLSDGMSSRLFTEVREKRSLCYAVSAFMFPLKSEGCVAAYSASATETAQETLDVTLAEFDRIAQGIEEDELQRLKAIVRSKVIIEQESSRSRAASIAGDWYHLGRVRSLDEVNDLINGLSVESINSYLADNPFRDPCIVTLGEKQLEVPLGVS